MSEIIISESYNKAVTLHRRICANAQAAQESLWEVCKGLKEMRDEKLYTEIGCKSFKEYCEKELELTDRQARNYIVIAENFSEEERKSISAFSSTKLLLLAKLDEPERTEITQNTDLESITVKALKEKIKKLEEQNESTRSSNVSLLKRNSELTAENNSLSMDRKEYLHKADELKKQIREQQSNYSMHTKRREDRIAELESQVEELKDRPIEVAVQTERIPDDIEVFKAYMTTAVDSMKRLTQFIEKKLTSPDRRLFQEKLEGILLLTNRTIEQLKEAEKNADNSIQ